MIQYRREALPAPLEALAWRKDADPETGRSGLVVVVAKRLSAKEARGAALCAIRKLPRDQRPWVAALALPVLWLLNGGRLTAAALVATSAGTTAAVAGIDSGIVGHAKMPVPAIIVLKQMRRRDADQPPITVPRSPENTSPPRPSASLSVSVRVTPQSLPASPSAVSVAPTTAPPAPTPTPTPTAAAEPLPEPSAVPVDTTPPPTVLTPTPTETTALEVAAEASPTAPAGP